MKVIGEHTDFCKEKNGIELDKTINDFTDEMNEMAEDLATKNYELKPKEIWKMIYSSMSEKSKTWKGLTKRQVINKVKNSRVEANGGDVFRLIEDINLSKVKDSNFSFCNSMLQCHAKTQKN